MPRCPPPRPIRKVEREGGLEHSAPDLGFFEGVADVIPLAVAGITDENEPGMRLCMSY